MGPRLLKNPLTSVKEIHSFGHPFEFQLAKKIYRKCCHFVAGGAMLFERKFI